MNSKGLLCGMVSLLANTNKYEICKEPKRNSGSSHPLQQEALNIVERHPRNPCAKGARFLGPMALSKQSIFNGNNRRSNADFYAIHLLGVGLPPLELEEKQKSTLFIHKGD